MYNLELTEEELKIHVTGLDSSVKLACQQIAQAMSSGLALKSLLPVLINLDNQFDKLNLLIKPKESTTVSTEASIFISSIEGNRL